YFFALWPVLRLRSMAREVELPRMRGFQTTAWLTNVTNSFLGKQLDIALMAVFAVSFAAIGYYNLAYTLANIIGVLLIAGLGGVGPAAMSAALAAGGRERLAGVWRSVVMLQVILTIPALAWALVSADKIALVLYGQQYAGAVPLLQLYLAFTVVARLVGGGVHQSALYVIGRQRAVLVNRWIGLIANTVLDVLLIPRFGPMGALMGTGMTQLLVGSVEHLLVRRYISVRYPAGFALRVLICSAVGAGLAALIHAPGTLGLGLSIACFVLGFVPVLLLLLARDPGDVQSVLDASPRLRQLAERIWPAWRRRPESADGRS
ncbi:MAG TPA: polysaccharide biosynthesis C-terminal domain-containing protein, partial [Ktedonobacterales bacterium]|nr:polysaccharide biosynthesis C-terminal domain-containing protein [Ktedonobacterales bacterium]